VVQPHLVESLNWRDRPQAYKNARLIYPFCARQEEAVMDEEFRQRLEQRLEQLENRVALLERNLDLVAAGQRRSSLRSLWRRPPIWTFEQYPPRMLNLNAFGPAPAPLQTRRRSRWSRRATTTRNISAPRSRAS
jgi:hypothetical protein